jgi:hypothetical protein
MQKLGLAHVKLLIRPIEPEALLAEIESTLHRQRSGVIVETRDG